MKDRPKRKILLLALSLCIVFSVASAESQIAGDLNHHCTENSCLPCLKVEMAKHFLKTFSLVIFVFLIIGCLVFHRGIVQEYPGQKSYLPSQIVLKVRLNS